MFTTFDKRLQAIREDILLVDVGNSSIHWVFWTKGSIQKEGRIETLRFLKMLSRRPPLMPTASVALVSSVVPEVDQYLKKALKNRGVQKIYFAQKNLIVPMRNLYSNPKQVGVDRLLGAWAAFQRLRKDCIVIDFGTAITFDVVTQKGEYLGGVIAPGIKISLDALFERTSKLPKAVLKKPVSVLGKNTVQSIRSGCAYGIGGLCDRVAQELMREVFGSKQVDCLATGGDAFFMRRYSRIIGPIFPYLVFEGLLWCYRESKAVK